MTDRTTFVEPSWHASTGIRLLLIFVVWMWVQSAWAVNLAYHTEGAILFTKYVVLYFILYRLLVVEQAFTLFAWAHVLGCFLWGVIAYQTKVNGRLEMALGPGVDDSNLLGFHLITGLTTSGFLFLMTRGWKRLIALAALPFILNGIILTASRSAVLGLGAAGVTAVFLAPRARRTLVVGCGALGVVLLLMLARDHLFWDRAATLNKTGQSEMDESAASRLLISAANWKMFQDYPFGAGHRGNEVLSPRYMPRELLTNFNGGAVRSAHNTFMAILVDQGIPGTLIFILLALWAAARLLYLRSLDKAGLPPMLGALRASVGASLVAYIVSGLFVNLLKSEVALWLMAMLATLDVICQRWAFTHLPMRASGSDASVLIPAPRRPLRHATPALSGLNLRQPPQRHPSTTT